jgi:hydrogenase nickel incorporation protein HypA/HybF
MHEVSLVAVLVEQVEEMAGRERFERVKGIRLSVGALSGVDPACLEFCFSEVVKNSVLEGSVLELVPVPVEIQCEGCGRESRADDPSCLVCPACGSLEVKILRGRDFLIESIEVV